MITVDFCQLFLWCFCSLKKGLWNIFTQNVVTYSFALKPIPYRSNRLVILVFKNDYIYVANKNSFFGSKNSSIACGFLLGFWKSFLRFTACSGKFLFGADGKYSLKTNYCEKAHIYESSLRYRLLHVSYKNIVWKYAFN